MTGRPFPGLVSPPSTRARAWPRLPLRTERLILRLPSGADEPAIFAACRQRRVSRWIAPIPYPYSRSAAHEFVVRCRRLYRRHEALALALESRDDGRLVGVAELHITSARDRRAELGYWIAPRDWGHGYASEASARLIAEGFGRLGLHRVEAGVVAGNLRSEAVLRGQGLRLEGVLRESIRTGRAWDDHRRFARLVSDPAPKRRSGRTGRA